jgi:flagellar hook-basal body complex protein FliE
MIRQILLLIPIICAVTTLSGQDRPAILIEREREQAQSVNKDLLTDSRDIIDAANKNLKAQRDAIQYEESVQLQAALINYQSAAIELSRAVSLNGNLKTATGKIVKSADVFLGFIKSRTKQRQRFNPSELKEVAASEINGEVVASVERLSPQLAAVVAGVNASSVDIGFGDSLPKLELELLRLKGIARRARDGSQKNSNTSEDTGGSIRVESLSGRRIVRPEDLKIAWEKAHAALPVFESARKNFDQADLRNSGMRLVRSVIPIITYMTAQFGLVIHVSTDLSKKITNAERAAQALEIANRVAPGVEDVISAGDVSASVSFNVALELRRMQVVAGQIK